MLSKYLNNIDLKGSQIISLPVAPTCLGPTLNVSEEHFIGLPMCRGLPTRVGNLHDWRPHCWNKLLRNTVLGSH
jgi:hypothetical protein